MSFIDSVAQVFNKIYDSAKLAIRIVPDYNSYNQVEKEILAELQDINVNLTKINFQLMEITDLELDIDDDLID